MKYFLLVINFFFLASCAKYMKPSPIETDGTILPKLSTAHECNKNDTTGYYENTANWKYFIINIYNTGDCPISVTVTTAIKTPMMVQPVSTDELGPIAPGSQYTFVFDAPPAQGGNGAVFRLIIKCVGGTPTANSCKYSFRFYGGGDIKEKEWKQLAKIDACDSPDGTLPAKTTQNTCITDEKKIWSFQNKSDADMEVEFKIINTGICPFTFKMDNKEVTKDHDTDQMITQKIKKKSTFTVSGLCNYQNQPNGNCKFKINSIKIK